MSFEFSLLGLIVVASWALTLPVNSLVSVALALLIFISKSISFSLLFLLSLNLFALIQAILGGKRSGSGRTLKRYMMVFFGIFCAIMGSAIPNAQIGQPLVFFGLIFTIANSLSSLVFYEHYEALSLKAFIFSVVIPSLAAINILLKVKTGFKAEYSQMWDFTLLAIGLSSYLVSSLLALCKKRLRLVLIYLAQGWIGILLFLSVMDSESLSREVYAAYAISAVSSIMLLNVASKLGGRYFSFAKIMVLGLPGTISFTALILSLKLTLSLSAILLSVLGAGYILQAITLISLRSESLESSLTMRIRFWVITLTQFASGILLFWMNREGLK